MIRRNCSKSLTNLWVEIKRLHFKDAQIMARIFNEFFVTKISEIRSLLSTWESLLQIWPAHTLLTPCKSKLSIFKPTTDSEVITIIRNSSKASCSLDPIPANFCVIFCRSLLQLLLFLSMLLFHLAHFHISLSLQL